MSEELERDWHFASEVIQVVIDTAASLDHMLESVDPTRRILDILGRIRIFCWSSFQVFITSVIIVVECLFRLDELIILVIQQLPCRFGLSRAYPFLRLIIEPPELTCNLQVIISSTYIAGGGVENLVRVVVVDNSPSLV